MTREEAREAIKEAYGNSEYTDEIIQALEQEPCGDCISRELVLRELDKYLCGVPFDEKGIDEVIRDLPSANLKEPRTDVLDKIIAEINKRKEGLKTMADDDWYAGKIRGYDCAIEIIDKYRQEGRNERFFERTGQGIY